MGALFTATKNMNPYWAFAVAGCVSLAMSSLFLCMVKEPRLRKDKGKRVINLPLADAVPASPVAFGRVDISAGMEAYNDDDENEDEDAITSKGMPEAEFNKLSFCRKVGVLTR